MLSYCGNLDLGVMGEAEVKVKRSCFSRWNVEKIKADCGNDGQSCDYNTSHALYILKCGIGLNSM